MGIILILVCLAYLVGAAIVLVVTRKLTKSKRIFALVALVLILFPFRRLMFYEALFAYYGRTPLQEIRQTVEFPLSVYWEDNVWPGFDEYGRHWMVKNYLDGIHLQTLALNGDDGKFYLFRASEEDFDGSDTLATQLAQLEAEKVSLSSKFEEIYKREFLAVNKPLGSPEDMEKKRKYVNSHPLHQKIERINEQIRPVRERLYSIKEHGLSNIMSRSEVYVDRTNLPAMNYRVEFNPLSKSLIVNNSFKMLHADRIGIIYTKTDQTIAFSVRYMAYAGFISQISGQQPEFDFKLGDSQVYEFDDKVLFEHAGVQDGLEVTKDNLAACRT